MIDSLTSFDILDTLSYGVIIRKVSTGETVYHNEALKSFLADPKITSIGKDEWLYGRVIRGSKSPLSEVFQILKSGKKSHEEFLTIGIDNRKVNVSIKSKPYHSDGDITHIIETIEEDHHHGIHELLNNSQNMAMIGGWEYLRELDQFIFTDQIYAILGLDQGTQITASALADFFTKGSKPQFIRAFDLAKKEGGCFDLELQIKTDDNIRKWIQIKCGGCNQLNSTNAIFGIIQDISARKEIERKNTELTQALEASSDGFALLNAKGEYVYVNEAHVKLFDYASEEDFLGKTWKFLYEEDEATELEKIIFPELIEKGQWKGQTVGKKRDGDALHQDLTLTALPDGGLICSCKDNTLRKQAETDLINAKKIAEKATEAKGRFLSTMSHEIRTPLNAVIGMSHLLIKQKPRDDQKQLLNTLKFSAENLLALINDILDYSKVESGKLDLMEKPFDVSELVRNVAQTFQVKAREKDLELNLSINGAYPTQVVGDKMRINQILTNLVGNAIKFTDKGSVGISLNLLSVKNDQLEFEFQITDTGIGIQHNHLNVIFEDFEQSSPDIAKDYGGTGLGLTITKHLVELMGSNIDVQSTPGLGSAFSFVLNLPLSDQERQPPHQETRSISNNSGLKGLKVLVAEDNDANRLVISQFLRIWETDFHIVNHGEEAINHARKSDYDVILMDLHMPGVDGYEAARTIRKVKNREELPIIAITASVFLNVRERIEEAGMNDFITKPFNPDDLFNLLLKYCNKSPEFQIKRQTDKQDRFSNLKAVYERTGYDNSFFDDYISLVQKSFDEFISNYYEGVRKQRRESRQEYPS